jgi:proline iminopeptidase
VGRDRSLHGIQAPTLVAVGRDDFLFPPERARVLADGIPGAQLRVFERSGHLPFVEERDEFLGEAARFLDQVVGPPAG